jgi:acetyl-CoA acetyltransferase
LRRDPITVAEVLEAPLVAYPFTRPMCCVTTDAGGALVIASAERARDLARPPVYVLGAGEASGAAMASQMRDLTSSDAFKRAGAAAFADAGLTPSDIDHAMLYDATAILPLMALEDLGFVRRGDSGGFVADGNTALGGRLPVNTNGGGLNYTHSGMYGMYALQESVRQLRGEAAAQITGLTTSLTHAIGGMFQAAGTAILSTRPG